MANLDDRKRAITLQNLLDMTSGIDWVESIEGGREDTLLEYGRSPDLIQFVLDRPMSNTPGEVFNYDSGSPHLVSAIIGKLAGMNAWDYAKKKLFEPLGIATSSWRQDAQGVTIGGGGLLLQPRDTAKIGYLYLRGGAWEGKRLLPAGWIDRVSHAGIDMHASFDPGLRYADYFWALPGKQVYMAVGYRCQLVMIFPALDIVAVTSARDFCPFGKLADLISGAVKSETALPDDTAGAGLLAGKLREISIEKPTKVGSSPATAAAISGKTYRFPFNDLNVKSLSLNLAGPDPNYAMEIYTQYQSDASLRFSGPIGLDGLYRKGPLTPIGVLALKGTWLNDHAFAIDLRLVGGDSDHGWVLSLDGEKPRLRGKDEKGRDVSVDGEVGAAASR
jgi:hypothetical protein